MKNGLKVFDADAHVIYPQDLWTGSWTSATAPGGRKRRPGSTPTTVVVDGRWSSTDGPLRQFQRPSLDTEDMIASTERDGGEGLHR